MESLAAMMDEAVRRHRAGQLDEAIALYRRVLRQDARQPQAWSNLGAALRAQGKPQEAEDCYRRAIAAKPDFADAHGNLANLLRRDRPAEALSGFARALALKPGDAGLHYNCALTLQEQARPAEAAAAYRRAVALAPHFADAWNNLGVALIDQNRFAEAEAAYRQAIAHSAAPGQAWNNLGLCLQEQGRLDEAVAAFERAMACDPGAGEAAANRVFAELYRPGVTLAQMRRLSRQWAERHGAPAPAAPRQGDGRPRLGFVSADLREHAVGRLVLPAVEGLTRLGFEIVCYSNDPRADALTARFRAASRLWREVHAMTDAALAAQIRADGIGILFDLSGHSRGNRLAVFARRAAPVQIAWAGYPATTGLAAMDYLLADRWQAPEGAGPFYSETLLRLPHSYIVFAPPDDLPPPGDLPAGRDGPITFGAFNTLKKINAAVIALWARILAALPQARLLLKCPALDCPATRARTESLFARAQVAPARLTLMGSSSARDHAAAMLRADIALDCFPYAGGAATLEALWMGLPVITWPGETFASRHSLGYLATLGLGELVADSADAYVALAVGLARDRARLAALRGGLRARILASPLADQNGFAADLAACLLRLWQGGESPPAGS